MMQREGTYIKLLAMLYREVFQAVVLFRSESWVLLEEMDKTVEGVHTSFLRQITGKRARRNTDSTWLTPASGEVWESMLMQLLYTYIGCIKGLVDQWASLSPIFELCSREKGCGRGVQEGHLVETGGDRKSA